MSAYAKYAGRGKFSLTAFVTYEMLQDVSEDKKISWDDADDIVLWGAQVGAIWYAEAALGWSATRVTTHPVTYAVAGIWMLGLGASYLIDQERGMENFVYFTTRDPDRQIELTAESLEIIEREVIFPIAKKAMSLTSKVIEESNVSPFLVGPPRTFAQLFPWVENQIN